MSWNFNYLLDKDAKLREKIKLEYLRQLDKAQDNLVGAPVDLADFADSIGVDVKYSELPRDVYGMIKPIGEQSYGIKVRSADPPRRRRFTLAHELAHYLLHIDPRNEKDKKANSIREDVFLRDKNLAGSGAEWDANALAAHILMPIPKIVEAIETAEAPLTISLMAEMFDVSELAMKVRLGIPIDPA